MKSLYINYNTDLNKNYKEENIKQINKNSLSLEDLEIIETYIEGSEIIIIKNDKLSRRKDFDLENFYERFIRKKPDVDIFFLSSYDEKCKDLIKLDDYDDYSFYKSKSPGEIECMVIESNKWKKVKGMLSNSKEEKINNKIKNLVINEDLEAVFVWPQVYYDKKNFRHLNVCRTEQEGFISPKIKELSYYWFLVTFVFTIIFVFLIYNKIPKDRFFYLKKNK